MMTLARGLADVCCFPCGNNTLMALGDTTVDVIMKNISKRKMMSVMEAMLKAGDILVLLFSAMASSFFFGFVQQIEESNGLGFHFVHDAVDERHQIVVGKHGDDAHDEAAHGCNHGFINAA